MQESRGNLGDKDEKNRFLKSFFKIGIGNQRKRRETPPNVRFGWLMPKMWFLIFIDLAHAQQLCGQRIASWSPFR
ncbi:MAG: hypothetical protein ACFFCW_40875, partial [Candidatus Hodarchaeota archaeon]